MSYANAAVTDGGYNVIGSPANNAFVDGTNHDRVGTAATPLDPKLPPWQLRRPDPDVRPPAHLPHP